MDAARKFIGRYPHLETLKSNTEKAAKSLADYEGLVQEKEKAVNEIHQIRTKLEASAQEFIKACSDFADDQQEKLNKGFQAGAPMRGSRTC